MKNFKILILILLTIILVGCGYTKEEKELIKQYEKQGKENAIEYIENKYGFTAKVKDVDVDKVDTSPIPDLSPAPNGKTYVKMEYNSKEFYVYINCEDNSLDGLDNYQLDIIEKDLLNEIKKDTLIDPYAYSIVYGIGEYGSKNGLISQYYDGTNLEKILSNNYTRLTLEYINNINLELLQDSNKLTILNNLGISVLINYKSYDSYGKYEVYEGLYHKDEVFENAINIDSSLIIEEEKEYYKFNLNEFDGIYFGDLETNQSVNLTFGEIDNATYWDGYGSANPTQVTNSYNIDTLADTIYIYFPVDKVKKYKATNLDLAIQCDKTIGRDYFTDSLSYSQIGDYYVSKIYIDGCINTKFTILESNYN